MKYSTLFSVLILVLFFSQCNRPTYQPFSEHELLLGTFVHITIYDSSLNRELAARAVDSAFQKIREIEAHTNPYDSAAEISAINRQSTANKPVFLSPVLAPLLQQALNIARETNGAYDPTLWPVFRLWHFGTDSARVPDSLQIAHLLPRVNFQNVLLQNDTLIFTREGMGLDLSGISKGYAVEQARRVLKQSGFRNFIIDAGGNLGIEWHRRDSVTVYIRHPRKEGQFLGSFKVNRSCGISTSGDYQDFFLQDSIRYHHILNPATGYPAREAVSVTVWAPDALTADGLSTALFVMGADQGIAFARAHPGIEVLFVQETSRGLKEITTAGFSRRFTPTNSTNRGR